MTHKSALLDKIAGKSARIGVVGLGYVGLPLALRFAETGFPVTGFDIDDKKVNALNAGQSYIAQIPAARIAEAVANRLSATGDFSRSHEMDALLVCIPTPLGRHHEPDVSFIVKTVAALAPYLRAGQALSLQSTTYPGTTEEIIVPVVEGRGFKAGKDCFVIYSPEREDPGNPHFHTRIIPKICSGLTSPGRRLSTAWTRALSAWRAK